MEINKIHDWKMPWTEASELQKQLAQKIVLKPLKKNIEYAVGVDVSNNLYSDEIFAAAVVIKIKTLEVVEVQTAVYRALVPYKTGFLSFREIPAILLALQKIKTSVGVVIVDGQGIAHPRGLGIASHLGLWLNVPTIGCAKNILYGKFQEPGPDPFSTSYISNKDGQIIGAAVRTKKRAKPLIISAGNAIDLKSSIDIVLSLCEGRRLPKTTEKAHEMANLARKSLIPT